MLVLVVAWMVTGCGGFQGSRSVSPATFLLPGLGQTAPVNPLNDSRDPAPSADSNGFVAAQ